MRARRYLTILVAAMLGALLMIRAAAAFFLHEFFDAVSCSQTNTAVTFGFGARYVILANDDDTNETFFTLTDTTASTTDPKLLAGEVMNFPGLDGVKGVGIICSTGETATVRVFAWQ